MSKIKKLLLSVLILLTVASPMGVLVSSAAAADPTTASPTDIAKAFLYASYWNTCLNANSGSFDIDTATINSGVIQDSHDGAYSDGLNTTSDFRCNDPDHIATVMNGLGIPWSGSNDYAQFICDMGATRHNGAGCTDMNSNEDWTVPYNYTTKFKQKVNAIWGIDIFNLSALQQYALNTNVFFLAQCDAQAQGQGSFAAGNTAAIPIMQPDGTFQNVTYSYDNTGVIRIPNQAVTQVKAAVGTEVKCANVVTQIKALATPAVTQEFKKGYMTGCADNYTDSSQLKACQDGYNNKGTANYCDTAYPQQVLAAQHNACMYGFQTATSSGNADTSAVVGSTQTPTANESTCGYNSALDWIACPITTGMQKTGSWLVKQLMNLLYFPTDSIFSSNGSKSQQGMYTAWSTFRNIGFALIVLAGLVMVISQALGLEILDTYTIRKLMPRLGIAMIGIALSWPLMNLLISFFNDIGSWTYSLIIGPFSGMDIAQSGPGNVALNWGVLILGTPALIGYLTLLGFMGTLSLVFTIVLAVFVAFLVLAFRWIVLAAAILLAPLAIAAYVLPGTQKVWKFWKDTVLTTLMMFPIIMAVLATGDVMARIATAIDKTNYFFIMLLYFAPFFMLPFAFKMAGGLMSTVFSMANDRSRGLFDRAKNYRSNATKRRMGKFASGEFGKEGGLTQRTIGTAARLATIPDQNVLTRGGRARFVQAGKKMHSDHLKKVAEADGGFSLGDTDETRAAIFATSAADFGTRLNEIRRRQGKSLYSEAEIREKVARLEAGTGARMGTGAMMGAAMRGQTVLDGAGWWNSEENRFDLEGFGEAANHLIEAGVFRAEELGAMLGENQQRPDMAASSFSQRVDIAKWAAEGGGTYTEDQKEVIYGRTYQAMRNSSAQLANLRTARAVAAQGGARLQTMLSGGDLAGIDSDDGAVAGDFSTMSAEDKLTSEFATFANFLDMAASASPVAREQFAKQLEERVSAATMSPEMQSLLRPLLEDNNGSVTNQQIMEWLRGNVATYKKDNAGNRIPIINSSGATVGYEQEVAPQDVIAKFTSRRREYSTGRAAAGAEAGTRVDPAAAGGPAGPAP